MTLTPYDRGDRLVPIPWVQEDALRYRTRPAEDYGKVDFDDEESSTVVTAHIEKHDEGYTLHAYVHAGTDVKVELIQDDKPAPVIQPAETLRENVKNTIALLPDQYARDSAEVYWADNERRAMILVPGEKHVRKQLLIMVTDVGDGEDSSAYVKGWVDGVQDTRIG